MNVLVTAASKYGATDEIARAIADTLAAAGLSVSMVAPDDVGSLDQYDAVVIGSGVYVGHWLPAAQTFVQRHRASFAGRRVWCFSSGPVGEPPQPGEPAVDVSATMLATGAKEHRLFAGKLDRHRLSFAERALVLALRAPEGDFRDWDDIRSWALDIGKQLIEPAAMSRDTSD